MVRAFIALEISDEMRMRFMESQEVLKQCRARMTMVEPRNIHITVKFLGEFADTKIPELKTVLTSIAFKPFSITSGVITVNNPRCPFTVWCGIEDGGNGSDLLNIVEKAILPLGFARENRRFSPHATLARVKRFDPSLMESMKSLSNRTYGSCNITGMKLKKSTLSPQGPIYNDLLEVEW
jgi:2'-5' RNA ligase